MLLHEATAFIYSMYPIVEIFGKQIGSYTICAIVGVAVCMLVGYLMVRKEKGFCIDDLIVSAVSIIIGLAGGGKHKQYTAAPYDALGRSDNTRKRTVKLDISVLQLCRIVSNGLMVEIGSIKPYV